MFYLNYNIYQLKKIQSNLKCPCVTPSSAKINSGRSVSSKL